MRSVPCNSRSRDSEMNCSEFYSNLKQNFSKSKSRGASSQRARWVKSVWRKLQTMRVTVEFICAARCRLQTRLP